MKATPELVEAIRKDREECGMTLYELVAKYGLAKSTVFLIIRNMNASKVRRAAPSRRVVLDVEPMKRPNLSKTDIGEASRQMICARLMLNEVKVFRPMTEDTPTDLLVLKRDGAVAKCQCKYAWPASQGNHVLNLFATRKNGPRSVAVEHRYTKDEVDFFLGYCLDNDMVYVIPFDACNGKRQLAMWILRDPTGNNGTASFDCKRYAGAYDLLK